MRALDREAAPHLRVHPTPRDDASMSEHDLRRLFLVGVGLGVLAILLAAVAGPISWPV